MEVNFPRKLVGFLIIFIASGYAVDSQDAAPSYRDLFTRYSNKRLSSVQADFISNITLDECAGECVTATRFQCRSFSYDNERRSCFLYAVNQNNRDVRLIDADGRDHYETSYLKRFARLPNHEVRVMTSQLIYSVSPEECARRCILESRFRCRGFNYQHSTQPVQCMLVESTPATGSKAAMLTEAVDFYQKETESALSNFINYGMGMLQPAITFDVYQRSARGVPVEGCAQLCIDEKTFDCVSFDYFYEDDESQNSCRLSQYIAANVQGLVVDSVNPRHNHFELIERFLNFFYATPYAVILGNNLKTFSKVTPNRCARLCVEEEAFVCRSFDYRVIPEATCLLSSKTYRDVGGLDTASGLRGFIHHFHMKPILDCGGNLTEPEGGLASPNWPMNYAHHENCIWNIMVAQHKVIKLRFTHFELGLQSPNACSETDDRLMIVENGSKPYCVMPNTKTVVTKSNEVTLQFLSNKQVDAQGFRAFYSAVQQKKLEGPERYVLGQRHTPKYATEYSKGINRWYFKSISKRPEWTCDVYLMESPGEFASPKWPGNYPPGSRCSWRITAPEGHRVRVMFSSFSLEHHTLGHCNEKLDHVRILDGGTVGSPLIGFFCGYHPPFAILSSGRDISVQFSSGDDLHNSWQGFHAKYEFEATNGTTFEKNKRFMNIGDVGETPEWQGTDEENVHIIGAAHAGSEAAASAKGDDSISGSYRSVMWTAVTCLLLLVVTLAVALFLVIRHYRQKMSGQVERIVDEDSLSPPPVESCPLQVQSFQPSFQRNRFNNLVDLSGRAGADSSRLPSVNEKMAAASCEPVVEQDEVKLPTAAVDLQFPHPPPRHHKPQSSYGKYHEDNVKNVNIEDKTQV